MAIQTLLIQLFLPQSLLKPSSIATNDLNGFYNEFGSNQTIGFKGDFKGVLNDFSFTKAAITTANTRVAGDYYFKDVLKGGHCF